MEKINWQKYGIIAPYGATSGNKKVFCPQCRDQRSNKRDKSLSINLATGEFHCHYCGFSGCAAEREQQERPWKNYAPIRSKPKKDYRVPKPRPTSPFGEKALAYFASRCISEATLTKMKVTEGTEWMPQKEKDCNTIQFNYFLDGELVNTKFRTGDKCFKLVSGARLIPYNIDAIKGKPECIITEGEFDTLSFIECGREDCISVPNGANANLEYLDDFIDEYFEDKQTIYIASDTDTKGVILRDELLRRFGADRCRVLEYGEGCKDANEHLVKFGKESLLRCLTDAPETKVEGIFQVSDFEQSLDALFEYGLQKGVTIGHENFDALCSFETKRLCIVTGIPSCIEGGTLIEMSDGTRRDVRSVLVGESVKTIDSNYGLTDNRIINKWDSGWKECYELTTRDGHQIVATDKHGFMTFDGWKRLGEIRPGDFIGVPVRSNSSERDSLCADMVKLAALWIAEGNKHTSSYVVTTKMPEIIDEMRDICNRHNLTLSNNTRYEYVIGTRGRMKCDKKRYISSISYAIRKNEGLSFDDSVAEAEKRYNERMGNGFSDLFPVAELKNMGAWGMTTETCFIPDSIMLSGKETVSLFLGWLWACDGSVTNGGLEYSSNSRRLCSDVQILLSRFGISSNIRTKYVKYNGTRRKSFIVEISSMVDVRAFYANISIIGKNEKLKQLAGRDTKLTKCDYIPATIKSELKHGSKFYKKELGIYMSMNDHNKTRVNRDMVIQCLRLQEGSEGLISKLNNNVVWREIKSIKNVGWRHTYDIEVENTHNFIANGIVTHNSGKSEFIDEIAEHLNLRYAWKFAYFSPENAPLAYHASKLIEKFTGKRFNRHDMTYGEYKEVKEHLESNFFFISPSNDFKLQTILDKAKCLVRKKGIKALVIDPYNRLENEQGSRNETQYISQVLDKLTNFAQMNDVLVILMAHPTKQPRNPGGVTPAPTLYDISGSANFYNKADFGITVHRDRVNDIVEVHVQKVKFRHLGENGLAKFKYNINNGRYVPYYEGEKPNWDNENHLHRLMRERDDVESDAASLEFESGASDFDIEGDLPF